MRPIAFAAGIVGGAVAAGVGLVVWVTTPPDLSDWSGPLDAGDAVVLVGEGLGYVPTEGGGRLDEGEAGIVVEDGRSGSGASRRPVRVRVGDRVETVRREFVRTLDR